MNVLDDNGTNWLVMKPDGSTETKTKSSNLNQLLFKHNLFGLLDAGNEIWTKEEEEKVTIIPGDDDSYTIEPEDAPKLNIGAHHKTDLVDALGRIYEEYDGETVMPIINLYESIRGNMSREFVLEPFGEALSEKVEIRDSGWFINGHLLLTFEGEFYHPDTDSRQRSGSSVIGASSSRGAYDVDIGRIKDSVARTVTVEGEKYRLTNKEMRFIAYAVWAIENTPDRR